MSSSLVKLAEELAEKWHEGQYDKAGKPYICHVKDIASHFMTTEHIVVSLLHDILEDTEVTKEDLISNGIPYHLVTSIDAMTRRSGELYMAYIRRLSSDEVARAVKMVDLRRNQDVTRFDDPTTFPASLLERYQKAYAYLESVDAST